MAVVSRVATLRIDDTTTHTNFRQWVATAVVEQTPEGQSVVINVVETQGGATVPAAEETLELRLRDEAGTTIRTFVLDPSVANQPATFWFTVDGTEGASARHGTLAIDIRVDRVTVPAYSVETDGNPNTPPAGFDTHLDRGFVIGTTTKTHQISNISLGGGKTEPAKYRDSLFVRVLLSSQSYNSKALTVALSAGGVSGSTNSTQATTRDVTFATVVDERFPAAVTAVTATVTIPNSSLTTVPYTVFTATTPDSINVDPRLSVAAHHFQVDDNVFALSKHVASKQMQNYESGFLWTRIVDARGEPLIAAGASATTTLDPVKAGDTTTQVSTFGTLDGQAGWTVSPLQWTATKPSGQWDKAVDLTAPTDIDQSAYLLNSTDPGYNMKGAEPVFDPVAYATGNGVVSFK